MHRTSDFVENRIAKFFVSRRRLLRIELNHFPAFRQGCHEPSIDLNEVKRVDVIDPIGCRIKGIGLRFENRREVRSVLGSSDHRERIASQHCKQWQRWSQLGDTSHLARSLSAEQMNDVVRIDVVFIPGLQRKSITRVPLQHMVDRWVSEVVEFDAIDFVWESIGIKRRRQLVALDDTNVKLDIVFASTVGAFKQDRFAVDHLGDSCRPKLGR